MILQPEQPTLALHARNASESAHPELWRGLVGAWAPALGYQGGALFDTASNLYGTIFGDPSDWNLIEDKKCLFSGGGSSGSYVRFPRGMAEGSTRFSIWQLCYVNQEAPPGRFWANDSDKVVQVRQGNGRRIEWGISLDGSWDRENTASGVYPLNEWFTWLMEYDSPNLTLWVNGQVVDSRTTAGGSTNSPNEHTFWGLNSKGGGGGTESGIGGYFGAGLYWEGRCIGDGGRLLARDPLAPFRLRDNTALATAAMFGETEKYLFAIASP